MGTNIALPRSNGRPGFFQCVAPEALYTAHIEPHPSWDIKWISADPWTLSSHWPPAPLPQLPSFIHQDFWERIVLCAGGSKNQLEILIC